MVGEADISFNTTFCNSKIVRITSCAQVYTVREAVLVLVHINQAHKLHFNVLEHLCSRIKQWSQRRPTCIHFGN
jgi:hypothetical protein